MRTQISIKLKLSLKFTLPTFCWNILYKMDNKGIEESGASFWFSFWTFDT